MSASTSGAPPASPATEAPSQPAPSQRETTSIDDHALPKSVIVRLAKSALPESTMIQKDAVTALVKSATVFVNYIAATANDVTRERGKKTINNDEVLEALEIAEFGMMIPQLKQHIEQFEIARKEKRRKAEQDEDGRKKRKVEGEGAGDTTVETNGDDGDTEMGKGSDDEDTMEENGEEEEPEAEVEEDEEEEEDDDDDGEQQGSSGHTIDMEEYNGLSEAEGEETDEALAEDSD